VGIFSQNIKFLSRKKSEIIKKKGRIWDRICIFHLSFGGRNSAKELPKIKEVTGLHKQTKLKLQKHPSCS
jgi:hypothetical protein